MLDTLRHATSWHILSEGLSLGVVVLDGQYRILHWNQWMQQSTGIPEGDMLGHTIFEWYPDIQARKKDRYLRDCLEKKKPVFLSAFFHTYLLPIEVVKGGDRILMFQNVKLYPLLEGKENLGALMIIEDVSEQVFHEQEIARLNRILKGIRNVNQLIARTESEEELLTRVCTILVDDIGYHFVWIGFIEEGSFDVKPVAFAGIDEKLISELKVTWDDSEYGLGVTGTAIKTGQAQIVHCIQDDPPSQLWREFAEKIGYQTSAALPLTIGNRIIGTLNVNTRKNNVFHREEIKLLNEVAEDIAFGIQLLRDRRKRLQAEQALTQERRLMRTLMDSIPDNIYFKDTESRFLRINKAKAQRHGLNDPAEAAGKTDFDFLSEESARKAYEEEQDIIRTGRPLINREARSSYGREKWHLITKMPLIDEDGSISGTFGISRDITRHKQIELDLRQSEKKYRNLVEDIADVVFELNERGFLRYISPNFKEVLGYTLEEKINTHFKEVVYPKDLKHALEGFERHKKGQKAPVEFRMVNKNGDIVWVSVLGKLVEGNNIFRGVFRDITERKWAEEQLQRLNQELEQRIDARTRELQDAQERLLRQEKLAILGQMAGSVGHELRTPLATISNAIYYLNMILGEPDEQIADYLDIIRSETRRAEKIIADLLDFSRVKSLNQHDIRVEDVVALVLEKHVPPDTIQAIIEIPDDLPEIFADPVHIEQVLSNLVLNAYQAMPHGGTLRISAGLEGGMVAIDVCDTGGGIAPEHQEKLFEPLFTTKPKGIGLGLAVCKNLIEANGGAISAESETGAGSTFSMSVPVVKQEEPV